MFDFKKNDHRRILVILFVIAISFNILSRSETTTVLSIMLLMIGYGMYSFYFSNSENSKEFGSKIDSVIKDRMKNNERNAASFSSYYIKSFPIKGLKHLKENDKMMTIAENLMFLKVFDKGRYEDMLLLMDRLQKVYMYILVGRQDCRQGMSIFMDIRELLLKNLYSYYIVLPIKTKHMYGLDPHKELDTSIKNTIYLTRHMITVLENYAKRECKTPYLDQTMPLALDPMGSPNSVP